MNTYYSNLIEGHNTRPNDIVRALEGHLDQDEGRRNLQLEAAAHVRVQTEIDRLAATGQLPEPASVEFIKWLHLEFYRDAPEGVPIYRLELIGLRGQRIEIFSPQVADSDIVSIARLDTHRSADGVHRRQTSSTRRYKTRRYKTCFSTTLTCKNTSSSRGLLLARANPKHAPVPARKGTRRDSPRKPAHGNPTRKSDLRGQTAPAGGPEGRSRSSDSYHLSSFRLPARDIVEALVVEIQQTRPSSKAFPEISTSRSS